MGSMKQHNQYDILLSVVTKAIQQVFRAQQEWLAAGVIAVSCIVITLSSNEDDETTCQYRVLGFLCDHHLHSCRVLHQALIASCQLC